MQRQQRKLASAPIAQKRLDKYFYLYQGVIDLTGFTADQGQLIPVKTGVKTSLQETAQSPEFWLSTWEYTLEISRVVQNLLEHQHSEGPSHGAEQVRKHLKKAHHQHIIAPLSQRAYILTGSAQVIPSWALKRVGEVGDLIEQQFSMLKPVSNMAKIWMVSFADHQVLIEDHFVASRKSFIFFTEKDARDFYRKLAGAINNNLNLELAMKASPLMINPDIKLNKTAINDLTMLLAHLLDEIEKIGQEDSGYPDVMHISTIQMINQMKLYVRMVLSKAEELIFQEERMNQVARQDVLHYNKSIKMLQEHMIQYILVAHALDASQLKISDQMLTTIHAIAELQNKNAVQFPLEIIEDIQDEMDKLEKELSEFDTQPSAGLQSSGMFATSYELSSFVQEKKLKEMNKNPKEKTKKRNKNKREKLRERHQQENNPDQINFSAEHNHQHDMKRK